MTETQKWVPCPVPEIGDILKWNEPLWAAPNKPRGKRDKIGEQEIIATLTDILDFAVFKVISVKRLSGNAPLSVKENDEIKRKESSIEKGNCHKQVS